MLILMVFQNRLATMIDCSNACKNYCFRPDSGSICLKYVKRLIHNNLALQDSLALKRLLNVLFNFHLDEIYVATDCSMRAAL